MLQPTSCVSAPDTFGNVVREAQAGGLPVIVCDVGGPAILFSMVGMGFITRSPCAGELAEAIGLTEDPSSSAWEVWLAAESRPALVGSFELFWHASP
jgi:hypothetical protein